MKIKVQTHVKRSNFHDLKILREIIVALHVRHIDTFLKEKQPHYIGSIGWKHYNLENKMWLHHHHPFHKEKCCAFLNSNHFGIEKPNFGTEHPNQNVGSQLSMLTS